jgi:hypothetical protein
MTPYWVRCTLSGQRKADLQELADNIPAAYHPESLPLTTVKGLIRWINEARHNYWQDEADQTTEHHFPPKNPRRAPKRKAEPRITAPGGTITANAANAFLRGLDAATPEDG